MNSLLVIELFIIFFKAVFYVNICINVSFELFELLFTINVLWKYYEGRCKILCCLIINSLYKFFIGNWTEWLPISYVQNKNYSLPLFFFVLTCHKIQLQYTFNTTTIYNNNLNIKNSTYL